MTSGRDEANGPGDGEGGAAPLVRAVREALAEQDDVLVAYLFGSRARGGGGPLSDVDVAVLLDRAHEPVGEAAEGGRAAAAQRELELRARLAQHVGSAEVDLVALNDAPVALGYRVLSEGRVVLCRDERARVAHWVRTVDRYLDMAPLRRTLEAGLRHRLEEGRFGRP
jgi:predicted nucleotidyltransferase